MDQQSFTMGDDMSFMNKVIEYSKAFQTDEKKFKPSGKP